MTLDPRATEASEYKMVLPDAPEPLQRALRDGRAVAWREPLTIRTYEAAEPSRYPMYLDHRVYQGSSGKVYPLPFTESVADNSSLRDWQAVHLENQHVRLAILPELGGRIHVGYDKTSGYDFFYRNNVIKPALVGLAGPWISGGVEFNWPQHHRPATYLPVETCIEEGEDGSVTVWCADHDPFARMSAHHGIRLRPDSSLVELVVRLHNRTSERQSFLWWANVAAHVHDQYQSFFPEDVRYVADHARRALTAFPAADRPYYGVDYPAIAETKPGADRIDWYRNIPVPTSYMIVDSQGDFFGGYDHTAGAGFVHWAEQRISPGKKQWTWGDAPFGHAWDTQLTDEDGPYVELMAGVYTDNQPDFAWMLPGETKLFSQYWYPIPAIGSAHEATTDAAVHIERDGAIEATFAVTSPQDDAVLRIVRDGNVIVSRRENLVPGVPVSIRAEEIEDAAISVELLDRTNRLLVRWTPVAQSDEEPWVAEEPAPPESVETVEELYLTGVHLSQYRHPTRSPMAYWNAAIERDPSDVRTNLALADRNYRAGRYDEALLRARTALARLTRRNANPIDAEAFYLAGLTLQRLGHTTEAEQAFGKAGWDATWAPAAGFELARSLARRENNRSALRVLDSLDGAVGYDTRRVALRAIILRRIGEQDRADLEILEGLRRDPLDATLRLLAGGEIADDAALLFDVALDLKHAGEVDAALTTLSKAIAAPIAWSGNIRPIAHYLTATILDEQGKAEEAAGQRAEARAADRTWAFPHGLDALDALERSISAEPDDAVAHSLIGMLHYGHARRRDALRAWEAAIDLGLQDPVLFRNAALAAYNVAHDDEQAWERYGEAIRLAPEDARLRYEQDQLAARLGHTPSTRLAALRPFEQLVVTRDDLTLAYVQLLIEGDRAEEALSILSTRSFHPWEGGEGLAIHAWDTALAALRLPADTALPANLGEARPSYPAPAAVLEDGVTDYFATSLPALMLFSRAMADEWPS